MVDEKDLLQARQIYEMLCDALQKDEWPCERHDEQLVVSTGARGDDYPIDCAVRVDAERSLVTLLAGVSVRVPEDQLVNMAMAVAVANDGMIWGGFDYDIQEGRLLFRMSTSYIGCSLSESALLQMLYTACGTVDQYNDRFMMLIQGQMTLDQFVEQENQ